MAENVKIAAIRELVRRGRSVEARGRIATLARGRLRREDRLPLAYLANECVAPLLSARILHPVIHPAEGKGASSAPSGAEKAEYAHALTWLGAYGESMALLGKVDRSVLPRVYPFLAFAYFRQWNWAGALPLLLEASRLTNLSTSDRFRIQNYLGVSLLHGTGDIRKARQALSSTLEETGPSHFPRFHWDALQLLGQSHYLEGDWAGALRYFDRADAVRLANDGNVHFDLMVRKFRVLVGLHDPRKRASAIRELDEVRERFALIGNWEHARQCDYYRALALRDEKLATHLYFGTPYEAFRSRLQDKLGLEPQRLPERYVWQLGVGRASGAPVLEVASGRCGSLPAYLKPGQLPQRLLAALVSDFYRRFTAAQLHELIQPGQIFNPVTSPPCILQAARRLRIWLRDQELPLSVSLYQGQYYLRAPRPLGLAVNREETRPAIDPKVEIEFGRLKSRLSRDTAFRAADVMKLVGCSKPTAVGLINGAMAAGWVEKLGAGPRTRYRLK